MDDKLKTSIIKLLQKIIPPSKGEISSLQIDNDGNVVIIIEIDPQYSDSLKKKCQKAERKIKALKNVTNASIILTAEKEKSSNTNNSASGKININAKHIILVASGKGGVGKSMIAANIAVALAQNYKVGLLDADIYGPSQPLMMGVQDYKPELNKDKKLIPATAHNIKVMSIGFMVNKSKALIWRGAMMHKALYQMLHDVEWSSDNLPLDYLIIDMPPGTGDVQLSLAQKLNISGAVIVSTPQDIALIDARRAVDMFKKVGIPVLGLIENMSYHICSCCGHEEHIFGNEGAKQEAQALGIPFLGKIPLSKDIRKHCDNGSLTNIDHTAYFSDIIERLKSLDT